MLCHLISNELALYPSCLTRLPGLLTLPPSNLFFTIFFSTYSPFYAPILSPRSNEPKRQQRLTDDVLDARNCAKKLALSQQHSDLLLNKADSSNKSELSMKNSHQRFLFCIKSLSVYTCRFVFAF